MLKLFRARRTTFSGQLSFPQSQNVAPARCSRKCTHGLREFSTPNNHFRCDLCQQTMGAWRTMWGCRECNYDECERCYEQNVTENSERKIESKPTTWSCLECTYDNPLISTKCEMCDVTRTEKVNSSSVPSLTCSVCCDALCEVAFIECGHCVTCEKCSNTLFALAQKQCPLCRKTLKQKPLRIYFG